MNIQKIRDFVQQHVELFTILSLFVFCILIFFLNIGNYALMDVDETRYVSMARDMFNTKDFLTLYLNGDYFFEKPPLYFWGECLSFAIFGKVTEFSARFPVALYGTLCTFLTYFVGRKIVDRKFGFISAMILATSAEFLILAKFAILDIVLATCVGFSTLFGFMTFFVQDKNKKYFWWLFYLFSGLAIMAKGIPGFVIPFGTMFFASIVAKRFKEIFKPQYFLVGVLVFLLMTVPWHIVMLKLHGSLFFDEYVMKHHIARFLGSKDLGREQPFYFYILTFLWGFIPWIFSMLAVGIAKLKSFKDNKYINKAKEFDFNSLDNKHKLLALNWIGFLTTFIFFSSSTTKLITYILPVYIFAAGIVGTIWYDFIKEKMHEKAINISAYILGGIFTIAGLGASGCGIFLPEKLFAFIQPAQGLVAILSLAFGIFSIWFVRRKQYCGLFLTTVTFMALLSGFGTKEFFNIDYKFGQNDLIKFAQLAKENDLDIVTWGFGRRYSLIYYSNDPKVEYNTELDYEQMKKDIADDKKLVIVRTKHLDELAEKIDFEVVDKQIKYTTIKK